MTQSPELGIKDFTGLTAVITGAGSGIGRATALSLARRGANIVAVELSPQRVQEVVAAVEETGVRALGVPFDVANDSFDTLRDKALEHFGRVDIVMNNVGVLTNGRPEAIPLEEWRRIIEINLFSVVKSNLAFLSLLIEQGHGHIVNTSSFSGLYTYSFDRMPYGASKAALVQISEGLAIYLRPLGVGVTMLCPGPVHTDVTSSTRFFGESVPIRTGGFQFKALQPEEVGEMVVKAITENIFMLPTHEHVREVLAGRAENWDAYIQDQIDNPSIYTPKPE